MHQTQTPIKLQRRAFELPTTRTSKARSVAFQSGSRVQGRPGEDLSLTSSKLLRAGQGRAGQLTDGRVGTSHSPSRVTLQTRSALSCPRCHLIVAGAAADRCL
jgi:hypothetical protein